jgi:hypothetical protein
VGTLFRAIGEAQYRFSKVCQSHNSRAEFRRQNQTHEDAARDNLSRRPRKDAPYVEPFPRKMLPSFAPGKAQNF